MSESDTSSADPVALMAYSEAGLRVDAQLEASAIRLSAVLDQFAATCTEYPLGIDGSLADGLRDLARRNREHNLWVRQVAEEFQRADASGTPEPVVFVTPQPSPVPEPVSTPTVPPAETDTLPPPSWDFWLSRAIDGATEAYKALVKPQWVTRLVPQVVEFAQRQATTVLTHDQQAVAYAIRESTEWVIGLRTVKELANEPAVALKEFLASPAKGVPVVGGAVQGITDAFEPDLSTEQRAKRIAIATLDGRLWLPEVGKATHYHAYWVHPWWVRTMHKLYRVGVHTFYRPRRWGDGADAPTWGSAQMTADAAAKL